jgi:hypothetical protein
MLPMYQNEVDGLSFTFVLRYVISLVSFGNKLEKVIEVLFIDVVWRDW